MKSSFVCESWNARTQHDSCYVLPLWKVCTHLSSVNPHVVSDDVLNVFSLTAVKPLKVAVCGRPCFLTVCDATKIRKLESFDYCLQSRLGNLF